VAKVWQTGRESCRAIFEARPDAYKLGSANLCAALVELEESPWRELYEGRPLTVRGLARFLNPFGIVSGSVRLGEKTPKGYYRLSFEDAWSRCPAPSGYPNATPPQGNTGAGFLDFLKRHTKEVVADEKHEIVNAGAGCGGVADKSPPGERAHEIGDRAADAPPWPPARERSSFNRR
jgi:putative DNA primase/helicase